MEELRCSFDGDAQMAIEYVERGIALFRETGDRYSESQALQSLARAFLKAGRTGDAMTVAKQALALSESLGDSRGKARSLRALAAADDVMGDLPAASSKLKQALTLFRHLRNKDAEADVLLDLARLDRKSPNMDEALAHSTEALGIIESIRSKVSSSRLRTLYLGAKREHFDVHIGLLHEAGRDADALEVSERARARLLLETVPLARVDPHQNAATEFAGGKRRLLREINSVAQQLQFGPAAVKDSPRLNAMKCVYTMRLCRHQCPSRPRSSWSQEEPLSWCHGD